MLRAFFFTSALTGTLLCASTPSPISMASDLNLSSGQIKELQRIDASLDQVKRHTYAKRLEVLTPQQRAAFFAKHKPLCEN